MADFWSALGGNIGAQINTGGNILDKLTGGFSTKVLPELGVSENLQSQGGYNQMVQQEQQQYGPGGKTGTSQSNRVNQLNQNGFVTPYAAPQVLGASTSQGNSGGGGGGGTPPAGSNITDLDAWARNNGYTGYNNFLDEQAAKANQSDMNQISEAYAPTMQALEDAKGGIISGAAGDEQSLLAQILNSSNQYDTQGNELTTDAVKQQNQFNDQYGSAYSDALRAYNALGQQRMARFGGQNSTSGAVGELAQQEFLRQQGQNQKAQTQGNADFATTFGKIKQFVAGKKADLEVYKLQALNDIKKNLNDRLTEIALRKGDVEANKTKDRLAVLQNARLLTTQIQQQDQQFRRDLGMAAVDKMQTISGRAFSAPEIAAVISQFDPTFGTSGRPTQSMTPTYNVSKKQDEFSQLNPLG